MKLRLTTAVLVVAMSGSLAAQEAGTPAAPVDPAKETVALMGELSKANPGNAEAGASKAAVCAACHGLDGNSADPQYPKIAGQHEAYLAKQLVLFKTGARPNPVMLGFVVTLSAQDMRDIGAYFAKQHGNAGLADETVISGELSPYNGQRIVDVGERIYRGGIADRGVPACTACHGPSGRGVPGPSYPMLGGQHAQYLTTALNTFKATKVGAPELNDANYAAMAQIAGRLTDEEIVAVASYLEGLHSASAAAASAPTKP